jgi:hypothetical protein
MPQNPQNRPLRNLFDVHADVPGKSRRSTQLSSNAHAGALASILFPIRMPRNAPGVGRVKTLSWRQSRPHRLLHLLHPGSRPAG